MVQKTYGSPDGNYYRLQSGTDDPLRKKGINQYWTAEGRVDEHNPATFGYIRDWVQQDPLYYCPAAYRATVNRVISNYTKCVDEALIMADLYYAKSTFDVAVVYAKKVLKVVRAIKSRDVRQIKYFFSKYNSDYGKRREGRRQYHRALTELPEAWLTTQFVIKPLYQTVKSAINVFDNPLMWVDVDLYSGKVPFKETLDVGFWGSKVHHSGDVRGVGGGQVRFNNPNHHLINRLGLADLIGTVYDVIPWTWALDYFTNLHQYIEALNPRYSTLEWNNLWWGVKIRRAFWLEVSDHYGDAKDSNYTGSQYNRFPGPPSGLTFQFNFELSLNQIANLTSAIALTLTRKFKLPFIG